MPTEPIVADDDGLMFTMARLDVATSRALDEWIASIPEPRPNRADAIGIALRDFLMGSDGCSLRSLRTDQER